MSRVQTTLEEYTRPVHESVIVITARRYLASYMLWTMCMSVRPSVCPSIYHRPLLYHKNSSEDEIANVNFFYDNIVHVEASAYAH